jgi:hypothetical protein
MKKRFIPTVVLVCAALLLASAGSAQEEGAKIITVTDNGESIAGRAVIEDYSGPLPSSNPGSRAINQMPGWPITVGAHPNFKPSRGLVFADLNNDGYLEIITSSTDNFVYAWDFTGASMPGFPVNVIAMPQNAPSVADLDGDGDMEIVQFTRGLTDGGRIYIIDHLGNVLPNFPLSVNNNNIASCPTLYDLDNDGTMEILAGERNYPEGRLHVFEIDGDEWAGNWPVGLDHVPTGSAAVGDVDDDGAVEIAYMSYNSIYLLELDGTLLAGWPKQIVNCNFSYQSIAFGDLDDDGDREVAVCAHKDAAGCYVFHHDGTTYTGWPKLLGTWTYCPPTITDLEGDGQLEILAGRAGGFGGYSNCFWAWTSDGVTKTGFPYAMSHGGGSDGPLTVADINNDGLMEIFADHNIVETAGYQGYLFGVDAFGNDLPDFPLRPKGFTYMNGASIGDVDGDGDYELGVVSYHDTGVDVNLYDLDGIYHAADVDWETYHKKNSRGGLRGSEDKLHIQGHFAAGSTVRFIITGDPGHRAFLLGSRGTNMFQHPALGWFFIDLAKLLPKKIYNVSIPTAGEIVAKVTLPTNPGIVGMTFYFQGVTGANPLGGDGAVTNLLGRTVQ